MHSAYLHGAPDNAVNILLNRAQGSGLPPFYSRLLLPPVSDSDRYATLTVA
jgi:hypothetical protein